MTSTHFELKPIYEGSKMQIYYFPSKLNGFPIYKRSEEFFKLTDQKLQTQMLHSDGYVWWKNKASLPTHVVTIPKSSCKYYIVKKDGNPPEDVQFVDYETNGGKYKNCNLSLFKVKFIPKIFDLSSEQWVANKDDIYQQSYNSEDRDQMVYLKVTPEELAVLESLDVKFHPVNYDPQTNVIGGWVNGSLPTKVWITLTHPTIDTDLVKNAPRCFLQDTMPLYINYKNAKLPYFLDQQGLYWQIAKERFVDKETAQSELGIESPVKLVQLNSLRSEYSLYIPLTYVKKVGEGEVLKVFYTKAQPGFWVGVTKQDWSNNNNSCYRRLHLSAPYLIQSFLKKEASIWLVSGEEDIDQLKLAPLKAGERTRDDVTYQVAWVQDNKLVFHSKLFGHKSQIYSIRITKQQRQQYEELKLQHWLPEPIRQWNVEDLIEYDQLAASGDYYPKRYLRIGQRLIEVPDYIRIACKWEERRFVSRNKKVSFSVYKVLNWLEVLPQVQKFGNPTQAELVEAFTKAAAYGLNKETALFHLTQNLGFSEVEIVTSLMELEHDQAGNNLSK